METNYAMIKDGVCVNTIVSDAEFAESYAVGEGYTAVILPDGYGIGDYYDGETWTKQEPPEPPEPAPDYYAFLQGFAEGCGINDGL